MALLAIDKGCQKLYLIGDPKLPSHSVLSPFLKNRGEMKKNILNKLMPYKKVITYNSLM